MLKQTHYPFFSLGEAVERKCGFGLRKSPLSLKVVCRVFPRFAPHKSALMFQGVFRGVNRETREQRYPRSVEVTLL